MAPACPLADRTGFDPGGYRVCIVPRSAFFAFFAARFSSGVFAGFFFCSLF
jgi:hypothetical protein